MPSATLHPIHVGEDGQPTDGQTIDLDGTQVWAQRIRGNVPRLDILVVPDKPQAAMIAGKPHISYGSVTEADKSAVLSRIRSDLQDVRPVFM